MKRNRILAMLLILGLVCLLVSCGTEASSEMILDNYPPEPDTPAPPAHDGVFSSEYGSLTFSGDGERVTLDLGPELARLTGLPEGESQGTYAFVSNLPPGGFEPVRYDIAHNLALTVDGNTVYLDLGVAADDGSTSSVGDVTETRIPLLFLEDDFFTILMEKQ